MNHYRIELTDEEAEELGVDDDSLSMIKLNKVFRFLIDPPDGEKEKQFHDQLDVEDYRKYDDEGNIYVTRFCIAEEMEWAKDTASPYLSLLRSNPESSEHEALSLYMHFLESPKGGVKSRFWRASKEKVGKSIISATEEHFFELSDKEKEVIQDVVKELEWRPKVLRKTDDTVEYVLLDYFYEELIDLKVADLESSFNWRTLRELIKKFNENSNSSSEFALY
jgi:hypothetical protein